jgi:hypothetical protein
LILLSFFGESIERESMCKWLKDAPNRRPAQFASQGQIIELEKIGGLHHHYMREAA